ncbi:MAG: ATP-binding protein [Gemmataceae bacterium]|nr:ATP-binding protein [Gemmataceae bacterium]
MSLRIDVSKLPQSVDPAEAVALAYPAELAELADALHRGLPCLVECPKELTPFVFTNLQERLRPRGRGWQCVYLDGRPGSNERPGLPIPVGVAGLLARLREAVRGPLDNRILVLPHLDLMTSNPAGLSAEAREVIALLVEHPSLIWIGFHDPTLPVPAVLADLALCRLRLLGVERGRLRYLVARAEGRKFGAELDLGALHRHVSGVNAVRLRRLLSTLDREDLPADPVRALAELRHLTLAGGPAVPTERLDSVGGPAAVKSRLREEVLAVLDHAAAMGTAAERARVEALLPRGLLFVGGAGAGVKELARALSGELGATLLETTAAELKSRYVGASEENLRRLFRRAREMAPAVILLTDLDSFAVPPGRATGPVEPSLLAQLLQELDGLPRSELVLVAGAARSRQALDQALLQPGRFELVLEVAALTAHDRREVLKQLNEQFALCLTPAALERAVTVTAEGEGDRPLALCRVLARQRLREGREDPTWPEDIDRALALL